MKKEPVPDVIVWDSTSEEDLSYEAFINCLIKLVKAVQGHKSIDKDSLEL